MRWDSNPDPTRVLRSMAELTEEVKTGKLIEPRADFASMSNGFRVSKGGLRHQTDIFALHKPRPRPAMTK
jgi:hypothetical protein